MARAAEQVATKLGDCAAWRAAQWVALYAPLPGELPTGLLVARAIEEGRELLWPRPRPDGGLDFALARPDELRPGRYGVRAPGPEARRVALCAAVLVVAPGLAFDHRGARLGRGGGAYDRALAQPGGAVAIGIGFEFQRVARLPTEAHDVTLAAVVTETGCHRSFAS